MPCRRSSNHSRATDPNHLCGRAQVGSLAGWSHLLLCTILLGGVGCQQHQQHHWLHSLPHTNSNADDHGNEGHEPAEKLTAAQADSPHQLHQSYAAALPLQSSSSQRSLQAAAVVADSLQLNHTHFNVADARYGDVIQDPHRKQQGHAWHLIASAAKGSSSRRSSEHSLTSKENGNIGTSISSDGGSNNSGDISDSRDSRHNNSRHDHSSSSSSQRTWQYTARRRRRRLQQYNKGSKALPSTWSLFEDDPSVLTIKQPALPCTASGMCSLAHVKPFSGDIHTTQGMMKSLAARAYKREIIVIGETRLNSAIQAYDEFKNLGLGHVLWLTTSAERCERGVRLLPELGCAWSSQGAEPNSPLGTEPGSKLHIDRMAYLGRALRLNHSVLLVEADILMFHDPYLYLKAPPLRDINLLTMRDSNGWVNPGVIYVQNAIPGGAVAYMINEMIDRALRWVESAKLLAAKKPSRSPQCWDQAQINDVLLSGVVGRPLFMHCWEPPEAGPEKLAWFAAHEAVVGAKDLASASFLQDQSVPWPKSLSNAKAGTPANCSLYNGTIRVPNTKGVWPEELGGRGYDPARINAAGEYIGRLAEDNPVLWPDPEDPTKAEDCAGIVEQFGYLPRYFVQPWGMAGASGWWNEQLVGPQIPQVMAHIVHAPGGSSNKLTVKMAMGRYNWNMAHIARAQEGVFFASSRTQPVPDVVAYAPEVARQPWASLQQLQDAIQVLVMVGIATNRSVAFPAVPCNVSWIGGQGASKLPLQIDSGRYIPFGNWDDLRCMWHGYLYYDCLQGQDGWMGGLLPVELEHYLKLTPEEDQQLTYSREEMLTIGKGTGSIGTTSMRVDIDISQLVKRLLGDTDRRVIWLGAVPNLKSASSSTPAAVHKTLSLLTAKQCFIAHRRRSKYL